MKEKIIIFIIGLLLGAVIASGAFVVYTKATSMTDCDAQTTQMGNPPEMPSDQNGGNGTPPEKPSGENGDNQANQKTENNNESN